MFSGSCLCGAVKITLSGEPAGVTACHCNDCRKVSGSAYSVNWVMAADKVRLEGDGVRSIAITAGSGSRITGYFCSACGTTLYRSTEADPDFYFVKAGVLDGNAIAQHRPVGEAFAGRRAAWVPKLDGVPQFDGNCQL